MRSMQSKLSLALGLALLWGGEAVAQNEGSGLLPSPDEPASRVGTRGANFLSIGVGARGVAMSGAVTAITEGVTSLYWNTAATARLEDFSVGFSYSELWGNSGIEHYFVGATTPFLNGSLGVSLIQLSSGDIPRTREALPSGEDPVFGTTFEWSASSVGLHYAKLITDRLAIGGALKFVSEGIPDARASYVGGDVGVLFETGLWGTTLGATLANVGTRGRMEGTLIEDRVGPEVEAFPSQRVLSFFRKTTKLDLPTVFHFGIRTDLTGSATALLATDPRHKILSSLEIADGVDSDLQTGIALEYGYADRLFLRLGKRWLNENQSERDFADGLAAGFGVRLPMLDRHVAFDYAYRDGGALDQVQVISVEFGF